LAALRDLRGGGGQGCGAGHVAKGDSLTPKISPTHEVVDLGDSWVAWLEARISLDETGQLIQTDTAVEIKNINSRWSDQPIAARRSVSSNADCIVTIPVKRWADKKGLTSCRLASELAL
jgi:hypothetical protein